MSKRGWKLLTAGCFLVVVGLSLRETPIGMAQGRTGDQVRPYIERPEGIQEPEDCIKCHAKVTPGVVAAFLSSTMGHRGIQNRRVYKQVKEARRAAEKKEGSYKVEHGKINCVLCHGDDHDQINETQGRVQDAACGGCHKQVYEEYELSGGHSPSPPEEVWKRVVEAPLFAGLPSAVLTIGRDLRYSQQGATNPPYFDLDPEIEGSSLVYRNGCDSCHTRHTFSTVEARKPESCRTCHMGKSDPVYDIYMSSKHGSIYKAQGAEWNWKLTLPEAFLSNAYTTPTCALCHMLVTDRYGDVRSTHNMTRKAIWGRGLQAAMVGPEMTKDAHAYLMWFNKKRADQQPRRKEMAATCTHCHSSKFTDGYLDTADKVKYSADMLVLEGRKIVEGLVRDGIIQLPSNAQGNQTSGLEGDAAKGSSSPEKKPALDPLAWHKDMPDIVRLYFDMLYVHDPETYKGAFHISPNYVLWNGYAQVQKDLVEIKAKADELRRKANE